MRRMHFALAVQHALVPRLGVVVAWMVRFPGSNRVLTGPGWRGLTVLPDSAIPPDAMGEVLDARAIEGSGDLGVLRSSSDFCAHDLVAAGLQCPRVTRRTLIRCSVPSVHRMLRSIRASAGECLVQPGHCACAASCEAARRVDEITS